MNKPNPYIMVYIDEYPNDSKSYVRLMLADNLRDACKAASLYMSQIYPSYLPDCLVVSPFNGSLTISDDSIGGAGELLRIFEVPEEEETEDE